jgi:hypothetical protein
MKPYRGSWGMYTWSRTRWRWVISFAPLPLYPGKSSWYPPYRWLGGRQSRRGHLWKKCKFCCPCPEYNLDYSVGQPIRMAAIPGLFWIQLHFINMDIFSITGLCYVDCRWENLGYLGANTITVYAVGGHKDWLPLWTLPWKGNRVFLYLPLIPLQNYTNFEMFVYPWLLKTAETDGRGTE